MTKVTVYGSHGEITVDRETGKVLDYENNCGCGDCYEPIARFDPQFLQDGDRFDILGTAYWDHEGTYEPRLVPVRDEHGMICDWMDP